MCRQFAAVVFGFLILVRPTFGGDDRRLSDAEASKRIAGKWAADTQSKFFHEVEFRKDGSFKSRLGVAGIEFKSEGTWQLKDGILKATITNRIGRPPGPEKIEANEPLFSPGRVLIVDNSRLVIEQKEGKSEWRRSADE